MKNIYLLFILLLCLAACTHQTMNNESDLYSNIKSQQEHQTNSFEPSLIQENEQFWQKSFPIAYHIWLSNGNNLEKVKEYKDFLNQYQLGTDIADHEFLQTARDWKKCHASEYEIPPQELWNNIVPTLQILQLLIKQKIIEDFTVTSVYRNFNLNRCAKGADGSHHVFNAAIDFRLKNKNPDQQTQIEIQKIKHNLCQFWKEHGKSLNMGLGIYHSGQIHIDSAGYRTWGVDHRHTSSPCTEYN